jgi:hypothetical protein
VLGDAGMPGSSQIDDAYGCRPCADQGTRLGPRTHDAARTALSIYQAGFLIVYGGARAGREVRKRAGTAGVRVRGH